MTIFQKEKLNECVTFRTGKLNSNAAVFDGAYPFFTCSQEVYKTNTYAFDTECVLLGGNNASAVYPIFYYKGKFDAYQRTYIIEPKGENNIRFFYYLISKKLAELKEKSTGATTKFLTIKILHNIEVSHPDPKTQTRIASVLSAYDDLIENNEKRIKALEEMAQLLYTEWFVKFKFPGHEKVKMVESGTEHGMVPEGWEVVSIESLLGTVKRKPKIQSGDYLESGSFPVVDQGKEFIGGYTENKDAVYDQDLIVFGDHSRCFKYCNFPFASGADGTQLLITNDSDRMPQTLLYYITINSGLTNYNYARHFKFLKAIKVIKPDSDIAKKFDKVIAQSFSMIRKLRDKNYLLSKTRDLLIPQLVTGRRELQ